MEQYFTSLSSHTFIGLGVVPKLLLALLADPNARLEVPKALLPKRAILAENPYETDPK